MELQSRMGVRSIRWVDFRVDRHLNFVATWDHLTG